MPGHACLHDDLTASFIMAPVGVQVVEILINMRAVDRVVVVITQTEQTAFRFVCMQRVYD